MRIKLNYSRIDLEFKNSQFVELLKMWKNYCKFFEGGQTERMEKLIREDLKKIKQEVGQKMGKEF